MSQLDQFPIGDGLCAWQRICSDAYIWDDGWVVFADEFVKFGGSPRWVPYQVAVQFRQRPTRERYTNLLEGGDGRPT